MLDLVFAVATVGGGHRIVRRTALIELLVNLAYDAYAAARDGTRRRARAYCGARLADGAPSAARLRLTSLLR